MSAMRSLDLEAIERRARDNRPGSHDVQELVDEVRYLRSVVHDRNEWARQLADVRDERDTALTQAEQMRQQVASRENTILKVEALLYEWEQLGRGDGIHGRQLRAALDGTGSED